MSESRDWTGFTWMQANVEGEFKIRNKAVMGWFFEHHVDGVPVGGGIIGEGNLQSLAMLGQEVKPTTSDSRKLSDQELAYIKALTSEMQPHKIGGQLRIAVEQLIDHIDAQEAAFQELVRTSDSLIDELAARIKALELFVKAMEEAVAEANTNHHLATNWTTARIEAALKKLRNANG